MPKKPWYQFHGKRHREEDTKKIFNEDKKILFGVDIPICVYNQISDNCLDQDLVFRSQTLLDNATLGSINRRREGSHVTHRQEGHADTDRILTVRRVSSSAENTNMAAIPTLPSSTDIVTVSTSVALAFNLAPLANSPSCVPGQEPTCGEPARDSIPFTNIGYHSPTCAKRSHVKPVILDSEKNEDEGDKENKEERIVEEMDNGSDVVIYPTRFAKHVTFLGDVIKHDSSNRAKPQIHVRLMRAKSLSQENILRQDTNSHSDEVMISLPVDMDKSNNKGTSASTPSFSKRREYFRKVSAIFRRRTSTSLINLTSQSVEDLSHNKSDKINTVNLSKSRSHLSVCDLPSSGFSGQQKRSQIEGNLTRRDEIMQKTEEKQSIPNSIAEIEIRIEDGVGMEGGVRKIDSIEDTNEKTVHKLERSYSLIRRHSEQDDSSHISFTRMPSLRRRKVNIRFLRHFATVFSPADNEDSHEIKEATHVMPLENGEVVVTDILSNNMVLFDVEGNPKMTFSFETGSEPWAICLTADGCLAVTLKRQGCVSLWSTSGEPKSEFGQNVLSSPTGILCDQLGRFIVADEQDSSVCVFNKQGQFLSKLEAPTVEVDPRVQTSPTPQRSRPLSPYRSETFFNQPRYVCITESGNYIIADSANHCVKMFDQDLKFVRRFGRYGRGDGCFKFPYGVASDCENNLYVADHFNNRVSMFSAEGEFIEHLLTAQDDIARPKSVAVKQTLLYVTHGNIRSNKVSVFNMKKGL